MKIRLYLFLLFFMNSLFLSQNRDTLAILDKEKIYEKIETLPYYNFRKGIGVTSSDSLFQLNIRFRMQNRLEILNEDNETTYEAQVRRLRLRFDGYVGNPKFSYLMQLSFTSADVGSVEDNVNLNIIRDAVVFYQPNKNWSFSFGQTKLPGNRQRLNSSAALQLTDSSLNSSTFNIDRDFGIQAHYLNNHSNQLGYAIKTAITTGEGRNWIQKKNDGLAYTGRVELYPLGAFKKSGEYIEGDIMREDQPKVYLGATYHFNQKANRVGGQVGNMLYQQRNLSSFLADAMLKYNGWAFMAAYMSRNTPKQSPITVNPEDVSEQNFVTVGQGIDAQLSYIFPNNWEFIGRFSKLKPKNEIFLYTPKRNQYSFGITKYIWEHAFKAQFEISKNDFIFFNGSKKDSWYMRFQIEIGI